jgi:hypothetical protein
MNGVLLNLDESVGTMTPGHIESRLPLLMAQHGMNISDLMRLLKRKTGSCSWPTAAAYARGQNTHWKLEYLAAICEYFNEPVSGVLEYRYNGNK